MTCIYIKQIFHTYRYTDERETLIYSYQDSPSEALSTAINSGDSLFTINH